MNFQLVTEKKKIYSYDYDEYEDGKGAENLIEDILADPDFPDRKSVV